MINLMVQDSIDPLEPHPLYLETTQKILLHTRSIRDFMDRLRGATSQEEKPTPPEAPPKNNNQPFTKEGIFQKISSCLSGESHFKEEKM
jgi:hypothetical protein